MDNETVEGWRRPPYSIEAEQSLLGGLMLDNDNFDTVSALVAEGDFFRPEHRMIYAAIAQLCKDHKAVDIITVTNALGDDIAEAGGMPYLGTLTDNTPSTANLRYYAEIVKDRSVRRKLIKAASGIADSAYKQEGDDTTKLLDLAEQAVFEIAEHGGTAGEFTSLNNALAQALDKIDYLYNNQDKLAGIDTGYTDLNDKTTGFQRGDLIIVAGRPSMGKTAFSCGIAEHVAIDNKLPVAIFSMEMPTEQLAKRMISTRASVELQKLRTGKVLDDEWPKITTAIFSMSDAPLFIDDTPALTPVDLRARARRLMRDHGQLGLILIDYLQLMQMGGKVENKTVEVGEISRALKALAKELNVPVVALSQLNRGLEQRPNKRPIMSDLRESGAIEQDADVIMFIYRDEVYNPDTEDQGIAEIIISKQRNGPIGTVRLQFQGQYTRFANLASGNYDF